MKLHYLKGIRFSVSRTRVLEFLLLLFFSQSFNAWADNYIFYDGLPIFKFSNSGIIEEFSLLVQDSGSKQFQLNQALYKEIPHLWSYLNRDKPIMYEISNFEFDTDPGVCVPKESISIKGASSDGLLTSLPLPSRNNATLFDVVDERKEVAKDLVETTLKKRRVSAVWLARIRDAMSVKEVKFLTGQPASLIVQIHDDWKRKSISALFILTQMGRLRFFPGYAEINIGGVSGSESEAARIRFVDHLGVGHQDTDAVLLYREAYESASWLMLKQDRKSQRWLQVAERSIGC